MSAMPPAASRDVATRRSTSPSGTSSGAGSISRSTSCWVVPAGSTSASTTPAPATATCGRVRSRRSATGVCRRWRREAEGPYEDLDAFLHRAGELALSLREQGISGMKIWPFDPYAEASGGHDISAGDLDRALEPFRQIRAAVGLEMDIMVELHGLWNLPTARRIARALEEFEPYWYE